MIDKRSAINGISSPPVSFGKGFINGMKGCQSNFWENAKLLDAVLKNHQVDIFQPRLMLDTHPLLFGAKETGSAPDHLKLIQPLFDAIGKGDVEGLKSVLNRKTLSHEVINTPNAEGNTLLHMAVFSMQPEMFQPLIEAGASIIQNNKKHASPFYYAIEKGNGFVTTILDVLQTMENNPKLSPEKRLRLQNYHKSLLNTPLTKGNTFLYYALLLNKLPEAEKIVERGGSLQLIQNGSQYGLMSKMIESDNLEGVQLLLKLGFNPNLTYSVRWGDNGYQEYNILSTVWNHTGSNRLKFIEAFEKAGANFNQVLSLRHSPTSPYDYAYSYPVCNAVYANDPEALKILGAAARKRGNVDLSAIYHRESPLGAAIRLKNTNLVKLLIEFGANPNKLDYNENGAPISLVEKAIQSKDLSVLNLLLAGGADPNGKDGYHKIPLISAIRAGDSQSAEFILSLSNAGANWNQKDEWGWTPFGYLISKYSGINDPKKLNQLVKHALSMGADPSIKEKATLYTMKEYALPNLLPLIVMEEANPYGPLKRQWTPLMSAVAAGNISRVEGLLSQGEAVNALSPLGESPLECAQFIASPQRKREMLQLLLNAGADVLKVDDTTGQTAFHKLVFKGDSQTLQLLKETILLMDGPTRTHLLNQVDQQGHRFIYYLMPVLDASVFPEFCSYGNPLSEEEKSSLLLSTIQPRNIELLNLLIQQGADVNAVNHENIPALSLAVDQMDSEIIQVLLSKGANPNQKDSLGRTPLHYLAKSISQGGHPSKVQDIFLQLKNAGADGHQMDQWGKTPLDLATSYGNAKISALLTS
ncbi:MAG: ankyrin repeat domain-containing protein [Cyanobacteria bacterium]|nr:ankyrin repeat domain-containing protein [Cyanobacteriota bacterium]